MAVLHMDPVLTTMETLRCTTTTGTEVDQALEGASTALRMGAYTAVVMVEDITPLASILISDLRSKGTMTTMICGDQACAALLQALSSEFEA